MEKENPDIQVTFQYTVLNLPLEKLPFLQHSLPLSQLMIWVLPDVCAAPLSAKLLILKPGMRIGETCLHPCHLHGKYKAKLNYGSQRMTRGTCSTVSWHWMAEEGQCPLLVSVQMTGFQKRKPNRFSFLPLCHTPWDGIA